MACNTNMTLNGALRMLLGAAGLALGAAAQACDQSAGEAAFSKCAVCHSRAEGQHLVGPSLHGLAGRRAAALPSFSYSTALAQSGLIWDASTLDRFLKDPQQTVPGTAMPFGGIKNDAERAALVCLLLGP